MGGGRQALVDRRVEPVKMGTLGCTHDSLDAIGCRELGVEFELIDDKRFRGV